MQSSRLSSGQIFSVPEHRTESISRHRLAPWGTRNFAFGVAEEERERKVHAEEKED